jgi:hypothetical protein
VFEILDLRESRVLAAGSEEVAEGVDLHSAGAALVEEGESLLEVGGLCLIAHVVLV